MIGIIGYGMVGKAVAHGFPNCTQIISDPAYNTTTIKDVCDANPEAIFVCVPTPTDDSDYALLKGVLHELDLTDYQGLVVVKSTVLPHHLEGFDVLYNPEFLSRATALKDFTNPPLLVLGGDPVKTQHLHEIYKKYSIVETDNVFHTDIKTASLLKYSFNTYYALKVTFMNGIYDIAQEIGVDYNELTSMMKVNPWIGGLSHLQVPGPDGARGYGGPCLPKDTKALARQFDFELLKKVDELNTNKYRGNIE